ncbi:MAG: tungstate ABC transporter substrate-binding protein WtpA [Promethearchaeia archaeon]
MKKKYRYGILVVVTTGIVIGGFFFFNLFTAKMTLKIFHAGSLAIPFEDIEAEFEKDHPEIDVQLEAAGSVQCVTKITESDQIADVLAVADYSLIPDMDAKYQDYYIKFAKNRMVLAYTEESNYASEINGTNFYSYLNKSDTSWGFSNPNLDPCGYRSLMVLQLAELHFDIDNILDDLVIEHSDVNVTEDSGGYIIETPENLGITSNNIKIKDKEIDLVTLLKEGGLDYAFNYMSIAKQHNLEYITLNESMDLSDSSYDSTYGKVTVAKTSGDSTGKAINYGITIPKNAEHADLAIIFLEYIINKTGQDILESLGQPPISPCPTDNLEAVPERLKQYCIAA